MTETDDIRREIVRLLPRLRAFGRSLTGSQDQADDLVQASAEKALRNIGSFQPGTRLDAWLFRIMRNTWIDSIRARREMMDIDAEGAQELAGEDGRQITEGRLHLADVRRAMARLPEDQRSVLMLVCVEGMRYREAAEVLGVPEGTVMSRLSRARLALAEMLNEVPGTAPAKGGSR